MKRQFRGAQAASPRSPNQMLMFAVALVFAVTPAHAAENLPAQTIVVFNIAVPDSEALAKFYAEKRGIAADHLVGLDCHPRKKFRASNTTPRLPSRCAKCLRKGSGGIFTRPPMVKNGCRRSRFISSLSSAACP